MDSIAQFLWLLSEREMSILLEKKVLANKPNPEMKPNSVLCSAVTLNIIKHRLICSSAMFLFNRYNHCVDIVVSCWHMALQHKGSLLNTLPKAVIDKEYSFLLFASLFVMRGYAESLILSQFLDNIQELRKLQRYILQFINYFPQHLIEFLISPSLIEEIMSKNTRMVTTENIVDILITNRKMRLRHRALS